MKMKKTIVYGFLAVILALSMTACSKSGSSGGGGKSLNSAEALKEYLDKQPVNSPDNPIKVAMKANEMMIKDIGEVIKNAGKYVSLDLSGSPLTEIPQMAFQDCKTLAGITIPNSVTGIGDFAFADTKLTSVTIPNSVRSIGNGAFSYTNLTSVTIPDSVTSLAGFNYIPLTSITIPNSVTTIGEGAFASTNLTSVTIPNSVTSIGRWAFQNCNMLAGITIPNNVTGIEDSTFYGCTSLTGVTIPDSVTNIGEFVFYGCTSLTGVTFQGTISSSGLNEYALSGDLRDKYLAGGIGTYTTTAPVDDWNSVWTKQ